MAYVVKMPKLGLEMERGTLLDWHVEEGDTVTDGEMLAEVESEKSIGEIEAREDGVLRLIALEEGETVPPGTSIGIVAAADEDISDLTADFETHEGTAETAETDTNETTESTAGSTSGAATVDEDTSDAEATDVKASPKAKRRADELGVDLTTLDGPGPQGAVTADDVENAVEATSEEPTPEDDVSATTETERATVTSAYHTTTLVTHSDEADALVEAAEMAANAFDFDVSTTDVLLLAVSATLDDHPTFNATFENDTHHLHEHQDIALVADVDGELVESIFPAVEERTFADLVESSHDQQKPVNGVSEKRATFVVANEEESVDVQSVVTSPTVAGLVADCSYRRAIPTENGVSFRRYLRLSLAYESRAVGDRDVDAFLETLLERIEELPELVLRTYR